MAGAFSFFIIQDFPDTAKFLTEPERAFVIRRLQEDDQFSAAGESLQWKYIFDSLLDWKTWLGSECPNVLAAVIYRHPFLLLPFVGSVSVYGMVCLLRSDRQVNR